MGFCPHPRAKAVAKQAPLRGRRHPGLGYGRHHHPGQDDADCLIVSSL